MPGVTLHFVLADRVLQRLRRSGAAAPFDPDEEADLNAFYHGAVGPDLGYFPGGIRILSDLAHCVRTGTLARVLLHSARSSRERAFALGWVTHVLADVRIHPVIGRGVGELLQGTRDVFVDGSSHPLAHLRVEMGLDAWHAREAPDVRCRRLAPVFDADSIGFLVEAYTCTYGARIEAEWFLRSHRATTRRVGQALGTMMVVMALVDTAPHPVLPVVRGVLQAAYRRRALRSVGLAYLNPVPPSPWLVESVEEEVDAHASRVMDVWHGAGFPLEDRNLDTGQLLEGETDHPGTLRALEGLAALGPSPSPQLLEA